jgi:hypothetical protein
MKVVLSPERVYRVDFHVKHEKRGNHTTVCIIRQKEEDDEKMPEYLYRSWSGVAKCNRKDQYNKATGKAKAMQRALEKVFPGPKFRPARKLFWFQFHQHITTPDICNLKGGFNLGETKKKGGEKCDG